jgi:hypothetical protein
LTPRLSVLLLSLILAIQKLQSLSQVSCRIRLKSSVIDLIVILELVNGIGMFQRFSVLNLRRSMVIIQWITKDVLSACLKVLRKRVRCSALSMTHKLASTIYSMRRISLELLRRKNLRQSFNHMFSASQN